MNIPITMTIVLGLLTLALGGYVTWLTRGFIEDNRQNCRVTPDQEREQWNQLWDRIADLPEARRIHIRNGVNVSLFNSGMTSITSGSMPNAAWRAQQMPPASQIITSSDGSVG